MNKANKKISIDQEEGIMSIQVRRGRSVESDMSGNVVIDYDNKGRVVRINLYKIDFDAFRKHRDDLKHFARSSKMQIAFQ